MVTANSVKCCSVSCKIFPSKLRRASQVARRSTFDAQSLHFGLRSRHDCGNTIISFVLLSVGTIWAAKHRTKVHHWCENFKITFNFILGHIRFVLMLVLHFAKSRDVTSLLKWVYRWRYQWFIELRKSIIGVRIGGGGEVRLHFG